MVEQIDRDGSGSIEFQEFVEMMRKKMLEDKNVEVEIEKAFNYFDDDNEVLQPVTIGSYRPGEAEAGGAGPGRGVRRADAQGHDLCRRPGLGRQSEQGRVHDGHEENEINLILMNYDSLIALKMATLNGSSNPAQAKSRPETPQFSDRKREAKQSSHLSPKPNVVVNWQRLTDIVDDREYGEEDFFQLMENLNIDATPQLWKFFLLLAHVKESCLSKG